MGICAGKIIRAYNLLEYTKQKLNYGGDKFYATEISAITSHFKEKQEKSPQRKMKSSHTFNYTFI